MKVIIPIRGCLVLALLTILFCFPSYVNAQCTGCAENSQELEGCDTNGDGDADFDLTSVSVGSGNVRGYFANCSGGTLSDTISSNPATYNSLQGTVYVKEFDNGGACVRIIEVTLDVNDPEVSIDADDNSICNGETTTITATAANAGTEATYTWTVPSGFTNPGNVSVFDAGVDGNYSVVVNDEGCSDNSNTEDISVTTITTTLTSNGTNVCSGPVTLTANISGGSGGRSYVWTVPPGATNPGDDNSWTTSVPGTYSVTGMRSGCSDTADNDIELTGGVFTVSIAPSGGDICEDGTTNSGVMLTATVSSGATGAAFTWNSPPGGPSSSTSTINATTAGDYTVTVVKDGCSTTSDAVTVNDKSISAVTLARTNVTCAGGMDGTLTVTATPAESDPGRLYNFQLKVGGSNLTLETNKTSPFTFTGLDNGSYSVTASNASGIACSEASSGTILVADGRNFTVNMLTPMSPSTIGGSDGLVEVSLSGGDSPYAWEYVRTSPSGGGNSTSNVSSSTFNVSPLAAGTYAFTFTDNKLAAASQQCQATGSTTVVDIVCDLNLTSVTGNDPTCNGDNGTITGTVTDPIGNYTITWSPSTGSVATSGNSFTISDLPAGSYSVSVTDEGVCNDDVSGVMISNPPPISFNAVELTSNCTGDSNGSIRVNNFMNTSGSKTISWNGPVSSSTSTTSNSYDILMLPNGTYTINVMDASGCSASSEQVVVGLLPAAVVSIVGDDMLCSDDPSGVLSTSPSNFSSYKWDDNSSSTTPTITVPNPGQSITETYRVTVTNSSGCTGVSQIQVLGLDEIEIDLRPAQSKIIVTCSSSTDGQINVDVSGGDGDYDFTWSGPVSGNQSNLEDIQNLGPGTYTLNVTDGEGCTGSFTQVITAPDEIDATAIPSEVTCNGDSDGSISVSAAGGTGILTYKWSSPIPSSQTGSVVNNLSAGSYTVTITDINGCFVIRSATVTEPNEVSAIITSESGSNQICIGEDITIVADGGTSYAWSGGLGSSPSITVDPAVTTTYTVTVTDANTNNCTDTETFEVIVNPLPVIDIAIVESSGNVNDDGMICDGENVTLNASGGSQYIWTGGNSNPFTLSPDPGTSSYVVTVTDSKGCVNTASEEITVNLNPNALWEIAPNPTLIVKDPQTFINKSTAECGDLVNCIWEIQDNANMTRCDQVVAEFSTVGDKTIKLTVENSCGCIDEVSNSVPIDSSTQCAIENFSLNNNDPSACVGSSVGFVIQSRSAGEGCILGTPGYDVFRGGQEMTVGTQFNFNSGNSIVFFEPGDYTVFANINDSCGCKKSTSRPIKILPPPDVSFAVDNPIQGCEGTPLEIRFDGFDEGERVNVSFSNDVEDQSYEVDKFEFSPSGTGINTLTITSVSTSVCDVPIDEDLEINILPAFRKVSETLSECNETTFTFEYSVEVTGGDPGAPLVAIGNDDGFVVGNVFKLNGLLPNVEYTFKLRKGDVCEEIDIRIFKAQCACVFEVGDPKVDGYSGCEGETFDISNFFNTDSEMSEFDPVTDTFIYVVHIGSGNSTTLGEVMTILPADATELDNFFTGFNPVFPYRLSVVGIKKASLDAKDFVLDSLPSLSFKGRNDCLSIAADVPLRWNETPSPDIKTANGLNTICRNAFDFMVTSGNASDGGNIDWEVIGLPDENIRSYGYQDTVFIYFEDNGQDSFQIVATEVVSHTGFDGRTFTCEGSDTLTVYVREGLGSPPLSNVLLWPGNIFASTSDTVGICFDWRFWREDGETSGSLGSEKYYYEDPDLDIASSNRIYSVDTWYCDNPECVTRVFYNNDGPVTPGFNYQDEKTFQLLISPNPNDGLFQLNLFSALEGVFSIDVIDINGRIIHSSQERIEPAENLINIDLQGVASGIYFLRVLDKKTSQNSISKVVIN